MVSNIVPIVLLARLATSFAVQDLCTLEAPGDKLSASRGTGRIEEVSISGRIVAFQEAGSSSKSAKVYRDNEVILSYDNSVDIEVTANGTVTVVAFHNELLAPEGASSPAHYCGEVIRVHALHSGEWKQRGNDIVFETHAYHPLSCNDEGTLLAVRSNSGSVQAFMFNEGSKTWSTLADPIQVDSTEIALAKSAYKIAVGNSFYESTWDESAYQHEYKGLVQIFSWHGGIAWEKETEFQGRARGDKYGQSLAFNGNGTLLAVGSPGAPNAQGIQQAGIVEILKKQANGEWARQSILEAPTAETGQQFGKSVALSDDGSLLAVSAHLEDANGLADSGRVYLFQLLQSGWTEVGHVDGLKRGDRLGFSLVFNEPGSILMTGTNAEDENYVMSLHITCNENFPTGSPKQQPSQTQSETANTTSVVLDNAASNDTKADVKLLLVDATRGKQNGRLVAELFDGIVVLIDEVGTSNFAIIVETGEEVKSVEFWNGKKESHPPFSRCGDIDSTGEFLLCEDVTPGRHLSR